MRRIILTGSFLLCLTGQVLAGQIYEWADAQGQLHYSELPPQGVKSTLVKTGTGSGKVKAPPATTTAKPQTESGSSQQEIDAKVKQDVASRQAELKQYCEQLRTNLAQLENNPRISVEENGQVRRLGEDERQSRIGEARKALAENCN
jgi:hypothetical protein